MLQKFVVNWWALAIRGAIAVLFGFAVLVWRGISLDAMLMLFGNFALLDGIVSLAGGLAKAQASHRWWVLATQGAIGVLCSILVYTIPALTAVNLLYLIAAWALANGLLEATEAFQLRRLVPQEWDLPTAAVLSLVLGAILFTFVSHGAVALSVWIALYAMVVGGCLIHLSLRVREAVIR